MKPFINRRSFCRFFFPPGPVRRKLIRIKSCPFCWGWWSPGDIWSASTEVHFSLDFASCHKVLAWCLMFLLSKRLHLVCEVGGREPPNKSGWVVSFAGSLPCCVRRWLICCPWWQISASVNICCHQPERFSAKEVCEKKKDVEIAGFLDLLVLWHFVCSFPRLSLFRSAQTWGRNKYGCLSDRTWCD